MSATRAGPVLAALLAGATCTACGRISDAEAERRVRAYDEKVIEAYRVGDVRLLDPVVGPNEGKKLTGLIGVKVDQGLSLDAQLQELRFLGVERVGEEVLVRTEERWYYQDRRIGTGERVGPDSNDHYFMRYTLRRVDGRWVVDRIAFEREPEVGRGAVLEAAEEALRRSRPHGAAAHGGVTPARPSAKGGP